MRALKAIPIAVLAVLALTACVPPIGFACPAIGYTSALHVTLAEPRAGLHLELCDGEGCQPGPAMDTATSDPVDTGVMSISGSGRSGWTAVFLGGQPVIGYRLTDAAGAVIVEGSMPVEWKRVGGSAQCGGPAEAHVVLPS